MQLSRSLTNHLFHLAQSSTLPGFTGIIAGECGVAKACFTHSAGRNPSDILQEIEAQGLTPFATFSGTEDLNSPPDRPQLLALPSLPHFSIGSRIKGVIEIEAYVETPSGWLQVELRFPEL